MKRNRPGRARRSDRPIYELTTGMFVEAASCAGFSTAPNAKYGPEDFARCIMHGAEGGKNVASVVEGRRYAMREAKMRPDVPSGELLRLRTAGVSAQEAVGSFNRFNGAVVAELRRNGLMKGRMDMAADFHNVRRYDKKPKEELIRGGDKASRTKMFCETYATLSCVVAGQRIIVAMLPFTPGQTHAEALAGLLEICSGHGLEIGVLTLDRGFYSTAVISCLQEADFDWIMPCPNTPHVKDGLSEFDAGERGEQSKATITHTAKDEREFDMKIVERRAKREKKDGEEYEPWEKYIAFATSDPELDVAEYAKRWGIETGYRQIEDVRAKTRSSRHGPRVFYMALTMMLFNLWIVIDALHRLACAVQGPEPVIPLRSALTAMLFFLQSGPGPPG